MRSPSIIRVAPPFNDKGHKIFTNEMNQRQKLIKKEVIQLQGLMTARKPWKTQ